MAIGGSSQELDIVIKAKDEASAVIKDLQGNLEKMKPTFQKMAVIGTAAFAGIAAAVGTSVKAFAESQKQLAVVDGLVDNFSKKTLKQFSGGTEQAKKIVKEFGQELQELGGISGEEAAIGLAKLMQITEDSSQAMDAASLAADFAIFKNVDYATAVDTVGKVLSGNTAILSRYGIELAEGATVQEAMNALQEKAGGLYEKSGKTLEGQMKILNESFGDLKESIGAAFLPVLEAVLPKIEVLLKRFADWAAANPDLIVKISLIAGAVSALVAGVGLLGLALPTIIVGFTLLAGPVGVIISAIGLLTLAFYNLNEIVKIFQNNSTAVFAGLKIMFKDFVNGVIGFAEGWANSWIQAVNGIIKALNKIQVSIPSWVPGLGGKSFGINLPTAPEITLPRFEHGGIVPGPEGSAVPIMAHGGEQIIPARSADGGGNTYSVNIYNPIVRSRADVNFMRSEIERALRDVSRVHKLSTI